MTGCGGCEGLGAHTPRCTTQPGWVWRRLADHAERIASEHGGDYAAQNAAWAAQGLCRRIADDAAATVWQCDHETHEPGPNGPLVYFCRLPNDHPGPHQPRSVCGHPPDAADLPEYELADRYQQEDHR